MCLGETRSPNDDVRRMRPSSQHTPASLSSSASHRRTRNLPPLLCWEGPRAILSPHPPAVPQLPIKGGGYMYRDCLMGEHFSIPPKETEYACLVLDHIHQPIMMPNFSTFHPPAQASLSSVAGIHRGSVKKDPERPPSWPGLRTQCKCTMFR